MKEILLIMDDNGQKWKKKLLKISFLSFSLDIDKPKYNDCLLNIYILFVLCLYKHKTFVS